MARMQEEQMLLIAGTCCHKEMCQTGYVICYTCALSRRACRFMIDSYTLLPVRGNGCTVQPVTVNMQGKVLTVNGAKYVFAPCCGRVVEYTEDHGLAMWGGACTAARRATETARAPTRSGHYKCACCPTPSKTLVPHEYPSTRALRMVSTYLCPKHTPSEYLLRYVYSQEDFEDVCSQWTAQLKQWYRRPCPRRV